MRQDEMQSLGAPARNTATLRYVVGLCEPHKPQVATHPFRINNDNNLSSPFIKKQL